MRTEAPGSVDLSRAELPSALFAPDGSGVAEGPGIGVVCTQTGNPLNCQLPDQSGHGSDSTIGVTSDATVGFHALEGFRNDSAGSIIISEVCWWGFYREFDLLDDCSIDVPSDDFTITLYLNTPGCPTGEPNLGGSSQTHAIGNTALKSLTGNAVGVQDEYEYSAQGLSIGPIGAGVCFWIGIQNNTPGTPGPNCLWLWSTADGDGNSYQDVAADPVNDFDLAVCLDTTLGDTSFCSLPPDELCIGAEGNCYEPNGTPGCSDECCCTLTCQTLPFCCVAPWNQGCADVAIDVGCTALPPVALCQDSMNCQVYTAQNAFVSTGDPGPGADLIHAADDFTVAAAGVITSLCFQGAYLTGAVADSFIVKVYDDVDGLPGSVLGMASEAGGTLTINSREDTNLEIIAGVPVWQYDATIDLGGGAGIAVVPDTCYWLEIVNNIGDVETWFWEWAEPGPSQDDPIAAPREGNGRCLLDGFNDGITEPDGYDFFDDTIASNDLAFCIGIELAAEACGFGDKGTETGPHEFVLFNGADRHLGWASGDPAAGPDADDQRRCVQAFTLPPIPVGPGKSWSIEHLLLEGFEPLTGEVNEFMNFEIFTRTALDVAPGPADSIALFEEIGFGGFDEVTEEFGIILQDVFLDPGDYWLTFWASNSSGGASAAVIGWHTNAPNGINNFCTASMPPPAAGFMGCAPSDPGGAGPGTPVMLRARLYPVPGFGPYTLDPSVLDVSPNDPTPVVADLYNTAFRLRMRALVPPVLCPWDCQAVPDQNVGINDFLDLLGQWTQVGAPCDFGEGPPGVGVEDFLAQLGHWGPCP